MNRHATSRTVIEAPLFLLLCVLSGTGAASADDDPAAMIPADTAVYIRLDMLAELRADWQADPLHRLLGRFLPAHRQPEAWGQVQAMMGLSGDQIVDRYFGRTAALVAEAGPHAPGLLLSRVNAADAALAVERLKLQHLRSINGFEVYRTSDAQARIAFGDPWMLITDARHADFLRRFLSRPPDTPTLADDPTYQRTIGRLPAGHTALAYVRHDEESQLHAAAMVREGRDLTLHYVGRSPDIERGLAKAAEAGAFTFGPIPSETITAASFNLYDRSPDPGAARFMDRLLAPKRFETDVLPKLAAPTVLFVARVSIEGGSRPTDLPIPAAGLALRLRDPSIETDLRRAADALVLLANMATLKWETEPIVVRDGQQGGVSYRTADFGAALAQRLKAPGLVDKLSFTYGRIGDWYILTTHEALFRQCVEASNDPELSWKVDAELPELHLGEMDRPLLAAWLRAPAVVEVLRPWLGYVERLWPELAEAAQRGESAGTAVRWLRGAQLAAGVLEHYRLIALTAEREDAETLRARLHLLRRRPAASDNLSER